MAMAVSGQQIRVRYGRDGLPQFSAEDLRRSGVDDLVRLAETDARRSPQLVTRGNGDGWVSSKEVEAAGGLHVAILGGYYQLLDRAQAQRPASLSLDQVVALMKQGASGPIKRRGAPHEVEAIVDPILSPTRYDRQHVGAHPRFLDAQWQAIEATLGPKVEHGTVTRGFTLPGYGGPELVRYLYGDWRSVIASHTFSEGLKKRLGQGREFHRALAETANAVAAQVIREIHRRGYEAWANQASRATQIGVADKRATGMASYRGSPADAAQLTPTAIGYAHSGYLGVVGDRVVAKEQPMIALELRQAIPQGWEGPEYYVPSHVPPERIERAFLGFSNWHDVKNYLSAPEEQVRWFALSVDGRDAEGRPTGLTLHRAKVERRNGELDERWIVGEVLYRSSTPDPLAAKALLARWPVLAPTVQALLDLEGPPK